MIRLLWAYPRNYQFIRLIVGLMIANAAAIMLWEYAIVLGAFVLIIFVVLA
jgi:hypothetical protein